MGLRVKNGSKIAAEFCVYLTNVDFDELVVLGKNISTSFYDRKSLTAQDHKLNDNLCLKETQCRNKQLSF